MPVLTLRGGPLERGEAHGRAAADRVHEAIGFYGAALDAAGLARDRRRALLARVTDEVEAYDPSLLRELEGVARGARVELADVVALNARSELLHLADEGCTAIACLPETTAAGHTLLAQNWDWHPSRRGAGVLLRILPDEGPRVLTFTEPGTLARCGLNERGVGVVGNALQCEGGSRLGGIPVAFVRRRVLSAASLQQAVDEITTAPRGTTTNHLVASAEGRAVSFESTPAEVYEVCPRDGLLEHSNHFRAPAARARLVDTGIARTPDTLVRDRRLRELADTSRPVGPGDLRRALADHDGYPHSICRHAEEVDLRTWVTVVSVVMDLDDRRLWLAPGPVCESTFVAHDLAAEAG